MIKAFKGDRVSLASWSKDRKHVVVLVDSSEAGQAYALVDLNAKRAVWLGDVYESLTPAAISPVRSGQVQGRRRPGDYRLSDPAQGSRSEEPAAHRAAARAARRAATRPASTGGARPWPRAAMPCFSPISEAPKALAGTSSRRAFGEWGRKMQTDLSDGVRDLTKQGVVDPKRVCIVRRQLRRLRGPGRGDAGSRRLSLRCLRGRARRT